MARLGNRLPTCLACLRRLAQPCPIQPPTGVVLVQARAKSNYTRPYDRGVVVRLLEDVPTFGRKRKETVTRVGHRGAEPRGAIDQFHWHEGGAG